MSPVARKRCTACGRNRALRFFSKHRHHKDGLDTRCKRCAAKVDRRRSRIRKADTMRARRLRTDYGIDEQKFNAMIEGQDFQCAICPTYDPGPQGWHIDHSHKTGKVRGLLCNRCNLGIGHLREDPRIFLKAVEYLMRHEAANDNGTPETPEAND